jgi:serine/threonine protein kinase
VQTNLPAESIVGERYQVDSLLGQGGFGAVYRVHDLRVRQNVFALKELIDADARERRRFTFEGELLKRTDHPSLPRVYRAFDDPTQGRAYLLMDYIEGPNLEQLRRKHAEQRLPWREVLTLLSPIFEAVSYLHAQQPPIIHRDIKPSNIIAPTSGERTVLVDFGIAKEFDQDGTTTAIRHASPGYGAPEQYSTGTETRTDIYGLGATLYTLLTGTVPVDAFFRLTQHLSKDSDPLPPVNQLIPEIPEHIAGAVARAMALEKSERFATCDAFWQALQEDATFVPVPAVLPASSSVRYAPVKDPNSTRPMVPPSRPRRRWIAVLVLVLLALCVGFASALFLLSGHQGQRTNASTVTSGAGGTSVAAGNATATASARSTQQAHTPTPTATHTPSPSPTSTPTRAATPTSPPAPVVPTLAANYSGQIYDYNGSISTSMSLNNIGQSQQNIHGSFVVGPGLNGNGPFAGTVNSNSFVQFTVHSTDSRAPAPLYFTGTIQNGGGIIGTYCSLDGTGQCNHNVGGYGNWSVQPLSSGS